MYIGNKRNHGATSWSYARKKRRRYNNGERMSARKNSHKSAKPRLKSTFKRNDGEAAAVEGIEYKLQGHELSVPHVSRRRASAARRSAAARASRALALSSLSLSKRRSFSLSLSRSRALSLSRWTSLKSSRTLNIRKQGFAARCNKRGIEAGDQCVYWHIIRVYHALLKYYSRTTI